MDTQNELMTFATNGAKAQAAADKLTKATKPRALNKCRFLCRSEVRAFLLAQAGATRHHKFTRVSEETLIEINEAVRQMLISRVQRLPSKGQTI